MRHEICKLLDISERSYYTFKKQKRPIIMFLERYCTKQDIEAFLETGQIQKFENQNVIDSASHKVCDDFFYTAYSRNEKNRIFADVILPAFEAFEKERIKEYEKQRPTGQWNPRFDKSGLIDFIISTELDIDKTFSILQIADMSDLEVYLLIVSYKEFLINS